MNEDIILKNSEKKKVIELLRNTDFKEFKVHPHYYSFGYPRHGVSIEKAEEIYYMFDKIVEITKRPSKRGFKYSVSYRISKMQYYLLLFFLDEKPMQVFNALCVNRNIDKKLRRKYKGF